MQELSLGKEESVPRVIAVFNIEKMRRDKLITDARGIRFGFLRKDIYKIRVIGFFLLPFAVSAQINFTTTPCSIIRQIYYAVVYAGGSFVVLMMTYGAIRYIYSADNPGGRNQGKQIFIQAIIGGVLLGLWTAIGPILAAIVGSYWKLSDCIPGA